MWKVEPTPELAEKVASYIRSGVFDWVAAVACGMQRAKFREWMRSEDPKFEYFQMRVLQAMAEARASREIVVAKDKPLAWLLKGPGRERPGEPGWTSSMAVTGKDGGAMESVVTQAATAPAEDYSALSVEELRTLKELRAKVRASASRAKDKTLASPTANKPDAT